MIIQILFLIIALSPPFALFSPVAQTWLSFAKVGWADSWQRDPGAGCWLTQNQDGLVPLQCTQRVPAFLKNSSNIPSQEKAKRWRLGVFVVSVNQRKILYLLQVRALPPCRPALAVIVLPLLSVEDLVDNRLFSTWKIEAVLLFVFPTAVFQWCATAAWESLKSPLFSHQRDRGRCVGLKSPSKDSWTWTWLPLCLFRVKAKSWSVLMKMTLQQRELKP